MLKKLIVLAAAGGIATLSFAQAPSAPAPALAAERPAAVAKAKHQAHVKKTKHRKPGARKAGRAAK